ncbi:MAG: leucine--tRNA ligase [Candidatus Taylorbacteria bacterium]|nr:leucine--tRNA ligase [Candidatus Taylorbacteria bacterium]
MNKYDHNKIEKKWQKVWESTDLYKTKRGNGKKSYVLDMFPYPSGDGLHVGHPKGYIATDVYSRLKRMQGYNILHPMGWDAFGLPAENYAIKNKIHPAVAVKKNIKRFKSQLQKIGFNYDWSREINTTDPGYYKWTQWIFLQMYKAGLAFQSHEPINWCPSCQTGLANEDLEDGTCERCGSVVEKRPIPQWVLRITKYADRLLSGLDTLNWPEYIKESQRNWIGRSEGAEIEFKVESLKLKVEEKIKVFTTRADTLFGVTYLILAPEHPILKKLEALISNFEEVEKYQAEVKNKTQIERTAEGKEKTGVQLMGIKAINPVNQEEIPVWIADYVLADYGTGAVMAVPAHDQRDLQFALRFDLKIKPVIAQVNSVAEIFPGLTEAKIESIRKSGFVHLGGGLLVNSGQFDGLLNEDAKEKIASFVGGTTVTNYKLRDWVFSRQRYWGEPIPLIHCPKCGVVPVPEKDLPVKLPNVKSYAPAGTGESPLARIEKWVNVKCPKCKGPAKRETNTMPQWAGSCWYYLRYTDPKNRKRFTSQRAEKYWQPVDMYVGGAEHATRHLIYARFWHKFLFDIGAVSTEEPFQRLQNVGLILASDGRKMSKRFSNVVNPDEIVDRFGADSLRVYEMFMGPFNQAIAWNSDSLVGSRRFLERVWKLREKISKETADETALVSASLLHQTIKKVGEDIEAFRFNTAVSGLMILLNSLEGKEAISAETFKTFLKLLAPFAPHLTEELWGHLGYKKSIHSESWPEYSEKIATSAPITIIVQVNGKTRESFTAKRGEPNERIQEIALALSSVRKWTEGKTIVKVIVVPDRLLNIVVKDS